MASPNLSEIITSTLRNRSRETADNVSKGNALLFRLKQKGAWKPISGGRTIVRELEYAEGNFQWYSGYDILNISPADVLTAAEFNWAQAAASVSASGLEIDVQNTGKEQVIDLFETRIKNAQKTMKNQVNAGCWSDGTANSGKIIGGLQLLVADNPATGTVGGINRAATNGAFWRNQFYRATADGGASLSATTIQKFLNALSLRCTRGTDKPDLYLADSVCYGYYWDSLQAIQRITKESSSSAGAGFRALDYAGQDFVYEDSTGIPSEHVYALNSDYIEFCYSKKRNFTPLPENAAFNQDAFVQLILWAGQLVTTNASLNGVLFDNA